MSTQQSYEEKSLLLRITEGDEAAFSVLFDQYRDNLYLIAWKLTGSNIIADDILQEVFLKIWIHRNELPSIDNFGAYLAVIAKRVILNELRKQDRLKNREDVYKREAEPVVINEAIDRLQEKQYASLVNKILAALPPQQAAVFKLIRLNEYSRVDAAAALGISPETVKKHLERAMRTVRAVVMVHLDGNSSL